MNLPSKLVFHFFLLPLLACTYSTESTESANLTEAQEYFLEIALGSEYGNSQPVIRKWTQTMRVAFYSPPPPPLATEFQSIIHDINALSKSIRIEPVEEVTEANMVIFITDAATYGAYEPNARPYLNTNLGFVWVYWDNQFRIYKGSVYVNSDVDTTCQKHLLREELTQSLGLQNDSYKYPNSIFYQKWTCTTAYSKLDKMVIQYILDPRIKPGMNRTQVIDVFQEMNK